MSAILRRKSWLLREWEVTVPAGVFVIAYSGRGTGFESIRVNGELAVRQRSTIWFVPRFEFPLAGQRAAIEVRVWPWLTVRAIRLRVGDEVCYTEGFGPA